MKELKTYKAASNVSVKTVKKQKPFQQGGLDSLCGIYCLVNVVHYLYGPLNKHKAQKLLVENISHLNHRYDATVRIMEGTSTTEIACALDNVVAKRYHFHRRMPFRCKKVGLNIFWNHMRDFLENNHGIILLGIYEHWTLVKKVTDRSLMLFDSDRMVRIYRSNCTTSRTHSGNKLVLYPARTYYIWTD